jgi:hypothetical protein
LCANILNIKKIILTDTKNIRLKKHVVDKTIDRNCRINNACIIEKDFTVRAPMKTDSIITMDVILIRLQSVLTQFEEQLTETAEVALLIIKLVFSY